MNLTALSPDVLQRALQSTLSPASVHVVPRVDSTNRYATDILRAGAAAPLLVVTDEQTAGRGRLSRGWIAPPRTSVLMSFVTSIEPPLRPTDLPMVAGVSVVEELAAMGLNASLKWPNDVVTKQGKVCGILVETVSTEAGRFGIVGIGINVNFDPRTVPSIPPTATSLARILGYDVGREELIGSIVARMSAHLSASQDGLEELYWDWRQMLATIGRDVDVYEPSGSWSGQAVAVDRDGALQVRDSEGRVRRVHAADVSLRHASGQE